LEYLEKRISNIFHHLSEVDAVFIFNNERVDKNFFYMSGLTDGVFENCGVLCDTDGRMFIFTTTLEEEAARTAEGYAEIVTYKNEESRDGKFIHILSQYKKIGIPYRSISHLFYLHLQSMFDGTEWIDAEKAFRLERMIKSQEEITRITKACEIVSRVADSVPEILKEGMTELDLSAEIDFQMKKMGAHGVAFKTIAAFGCNTSKPHYSGANVSLSRGDVILIDFGAEYMGYSSDITRTYLTGMPGKHLIDIYYTLLSAQKTAIDLIKAGNSSKDVEDEVRKIIDSNENYRGKFIHSLGHSLGMDVHDGPYPDADFNHEFAENMVLTVEPGIYIPGLYGMRIEDDIVVGREGCTVLTTARKEPISYEI